MKPDILGITKANLVKPIWAEKGACETEVPFMFKCIDSTIGTSWRKEDGTNERLFSNRDGNRP